MKKMILTSSALLVFAMILVLGCNKTSAPYGIDAPNGLDVPTATPNIGKFYVSVQDLDKQVPFSNATVLAIQPDGAVTFNSTTGIDGRAAFSPNSIQTGIWTFIIPTQNGFPFVTSKITQAIDNPNQTVNFSAGEATLALTPTSLTSYFSNSGGVFTYNAVYQQKNPLLVPITLSLPSLPTNWSVTYGPATIGFNSVDQAGITVSAVSCVDETPALAVTGFDNETPTPMVRCNSAPITITKGGTFSSNIALILNHGGYSDSLSLAFLQSHGGGLSNCSGSVTYHEWGLSYFQTAYTNGCNLAPVTLIFTWNANGTDCVCGNQLTVDESGWSNNGNVAIECGGEAVTQIVSSNNPVTIGILTSYNNAAPSINVKLLSDVFPNGLSGSVTLPEAVSFSPITVINQSY